MAAAKLKAASALYNLKTKKYKLAALKFTEVCCGVCSILLCLDHKLGVILQFQAYAHSPSPAHLHQQCHQHPALRIGI